MLAIAIYRFAGTSGAAYLLSPRSLLSYLVQLVHYMYMYGILDLLPHDACTRRLARFLIEIVLYPGALSLNLSWSFILELHPARLPSPESLADRILGPCTIIDLSL